MKKLTVVFMSICIIFSLNITCLAENTGSILIKFVLRSDTSKPVSGLIGKKLPLKSGSFC
ncbi:hypothetical protein [Oceanirhabdus sp. W0125-5]|uniref:hypothetical protein n=1 Tax=Oceanirhabdus sp. W0125-5 TaxID=2999116 RepID=UPI0022F32460|nr:hypothetical protein [Oceanirhabdus sp. W0125-5]WBW99063.1 hypothetical protein OW730_10045 [Oceanirhabdus sp. W0125-5]